MYVKVYNGKVGKAITVLARKMREDGDLQRVVERMRYEKPSDKRRRRRKEAISRQKREMYDLRDYN